MNHAEDFPPFRSAAVLGAGVMGAQIAAHLANTGLRVELLDLAAKDGDPNTVVETLFARAMKLRPEPCFTPDVAARVRLGNFDEHWNRLADVDWVIEAVVERLDIKQQITTRLEGTVRADAVVSTNTSGLPIHEIAAGRAEGFRRRFLGTHFFNPPRYMKLLELVPTPDTDPDVLARVVAFARLHLGKGCVVAKDTPNFIANRIGVYSILQTIRSAESMGLSFADVDALTGPLIGRPKSATYRTCDVVGLDTLVYVANSLHAAVIDENREAFAVPPVLQQLVERGATGQKAKAGFYKKAGKQILSFDPASGDYAPPPPSQLDGVDALKKAGSLADRLRALWDDQGRGGAFFRATTTDLLGYAARRIPEITDNPADLDRAIRWGFGWEMGPFEIWDALGAKRVNAELKAQGTALPDWVTDKAPPFYGASSDTGPTRGRDVLLPSGTRQSDAPPADELDLVAPGQADAALVWSSDQAALHDLGDGVACFEMRSKARTLTTGVMAGLQECLELVERGPWRGLVIGHGAEHFSPGANLVEMATAAQAGQFDEIDAIIRRFQNTIQAVHEAAKPVVVATSGRVLGGACELLMACRHPVVAVESYVGLVEIGAGLIPAGCGTMRMAAWAADRAESREPQAVQPWLQRAFQTLATATVATSGPLAQRLGFAAPAATLVRRAERRLWVAKQEVLRIASQGYLPAPAQRTVYVLGASGRAALDAAVHQMLRAGHADEGSAQIAQRLGWVITGGDLTTPAEVPEQYLLDLERETFVALLREPYTQARIAAILGKGKK
ncbi:MAG: 3-hydroxyacyl-CoA dehydrogenase/enoyl-CoA hydratase family protein [Planctomycetota bacterium]